MKKVAFILSAVVFTSVFFSCKNETPVTVTDPITVEASNDIAMADLLEDTTTDTQYLYVTATSGLSLREYGNLNSDKLAKMPYGTRVTVVEAEPNNTMTVGGIKGGMDQIRFNHKEGFAFNGYLSKYFPPERDITVKGYGEELKQLFPEVTYTESVGGTVSNPINAETISLPNAAWHEAYFMAQRLFDFPKEFTFPNPKGKDSEIVFDGKPKKGIWVSQLEVKRSYNELQKIEYVYGSKKFDSKVRIEKEGDVMKISKTEALK
jgi:hypothetical protein